MRTLVLSLFAFVRGFLAAKAAVALENAALRQQLAAYLRAEKRPRLGPGDRAFWLLLHRLWADWTHLLVAVKPATVIAWHRGGFRAIWAWKSRPGRPRIPRRHNGFIKRISTDHPEWGEDKIAEELAAKFGVHHSGSTIRRYMVRHRPPPRRDQTWRTFAWASPGFVDSVIMPQGSPSVPSIRTPSG